MTLQSAYVSIKNSLMASYASSYREEVGYWLQNLIAARSLQLTRLYAAIHRYKLENPELNLNSREAIIHLLHAHSGVVFLSLENIPASLALKLLGPCLASQPVASASSEFLKSEQSMNQWIDGNRELIAESHEAGEGLPELSWNDLPNELFPGLKGS